MYNSRKKKKDSVCIVHTKLMIIYRIYSPIIEVD